MTPRPPPARPGARRAFTLLELAVVVVILGILAASAAPALRTLSGARAAAARDEVERLFVEARARAMAGAGPTGVSVNAADSALQLMERPPVGVPRPALGPLGEPSPTVSLPELFGGVRIESWTGPDGSGTPGVVWFSHAGEPQRRNASGVLLGPATADTVVRLTGGATVTARRMSGAVE